MRDFFLPGRIETALRNAPSQPVTRLSEADYIHVRVRASTGHIIAYTPTHGLYMSAGATETQVNWEEAWQIKRLPTPE